MGIIKSKVVIQMARWQDLLSLKQGYVERQNIVSAECSVLA